MITLSIIWPFLFLYLTCSWMNIRLPGAGADTEKRQIHELISTKAVQNVTKLRLFRFITEYISTN